MYTINANKNKNINKKINIVLKFEHVYECMDKGDTGIRYKYMK